MLIPRALIGDMDDFRSWILCAALAEAEGGDRFEKVLDNCPDEDHLEIKLMVNGVEADFNVVMKRLEEEYNHAAEKKAMEIFKQKYEKGYLDLEEALDSMKEAVIEDIKERYPSFDLDL